MSAICVFCTSSSAAPQSYLEVAAEVGRLIAERGHSLVSGGGAISAMGEVARAARAGGAHTVGIIPAKLTESEIGDRDAQEFIVTADMRDRKGLMEKRSDGFLVLPGGIGTLEELFDMWVGRVLGMHDKPVVVLDFDDLYAGLRLQLVTLLERGLVRQEALDLLGWASDARGAVELLEQQIALRPQAAPTDEETIEAAPEV